MNDTASSSSSSSAAAAAAAAATEDSVIDSDHRPQPRNCTPACTAHLFTFICVKHFGIIFGYISPDSEGYRLT